MKTEKIASLCPQCQAPLPANAPQGLCPKCLLAAVATPTEAGQPASTSPAPPALESVAAAFPQLEILELIGAGGMGVVYKVRQPRLDRCVALKLLPQSLAADAAFAERFNREARLLARLNHPSIVTVHDFGQSGGFFYLLMEFVDGVNLRQAMEAGRFTPQQALLLVPKICEALQYAHDEGILHRDIKPSNILLDTRGRVKIADFGIAKLIGQQTHDATLTASGAAIGTPQYMAPEQLEHPQDVDQRADIYSLGVVFYEMLTGELPIGRFAPPSEKSAVDSRVDAVVFHALEKEREKRFRSAGEVKTSVEAITASAGSGVKSCSAPKATADTLQAPPRQLPAETLAGPAKTDTAARRAICYLSMPKRMRNCFPGASAHIFLCAGELRLDEDRLAFTTALWATIEIPLTQIREFGLGLFRMWNTPWLGVKYARFNYLVVTFTENGRTRTVMLTPVPKGANSAAEINSFVAQWHDAVQAAIVARIGVAPKVPDRRVMLTGVQGPWLQVILPLMLCWFAGLATTFTNVTAGAMMIGFFTAIITVLSIGYFKMNAAIERGDLDAVTSDEPPGDLFAGTADVSSPAAGSRRPLLWTLSAWAFIVIGLLAVIETLASIYAPPHRPTFCPGLAHIFAGIALLTLSRRWRIVALVALALSVLVGAFVSINMAISPEHGAVVLLPSMKPISVMEHPLLGASFGTFLALMLLWPCYLLLNTTGRQLFGIVPKK